MGCLGWLLGERRENSAWEEQPIGPLTVVVKSLRGERPVLRRERTDRSTVGMQKECKRKNKNEEENREEKMKENVHKRERKESLFSRRQKGREAVERETNATPEQVIAKEGGEPHDQSQFYTGKEIETATS